ncbi:hypothetical protein XVE_4892 [Xanthomonas vesicatoria ATCC 35937]|uniref:Uncharacterized protein n=1 Tax=Xanthomonas vesicatoria ATCC 35937 TaxID=925775 RepID=F0BKS7_9XANT|nr:hypothetical protein XVE_4892 [Xanthomonas vesicatoria ATCC 35937]
MGVGACDQVGQLLPEDVDAGFLLLAEAFELGAQFGEPQGQQFAGALLRQAALFACLAGIFAKRVAQQVQTLIGAGGQFGEIAREGFQAPVLLPRQAFELLAQFAASVALFGAQRMLQRGSGRTPQQGQQLQHEDYHEQSEKDQGFG